MGASIPGTLNVIAWMIWARFAVDYLARSLLSVEKTRFVRTHKLDLVMVQLPMLRASSVLRHGLPFVGTEKVAGSIVTIVIAVVFVSAFLR